MRGVKYSVRNHNLGGIVLHSSQDDQVATNYFTFSNDVIGVLAVSLAATSLQFEHPEPFAWFFFVVVFIWTFSKGTEYRKISRRYTERYKGVLGFLVLMWKLNIYLVGFTTLFLIGVGVIDKAKIYAWCGF